METDGVGRRGRPGAESEADSTVETAKKIEARRTNWAAAVGKVFCGRSKYSENVKDGGRTVCVCATACLSACVGYNFGVLIKIAERAESTPHRLLVAGCSAAVKLLPLTSG